MARLPNDYNRVVEFYKKFLKEIPPSHFIDTCIQCSIPFPVHSCNKERDNILCPFGCRQERKKKKSRERSKAYYKTPEGRKKKQILNQRYRDKKASKKPEYLSSKDPESPKFWKPLKPLIRLFIPDSSIDIEIEKILVKKRQLRLFYLADLIKLE